MKLLHIATAILLLLAANSAQADNQKKKYAEIKFEKATIDIGTFSQDDPVQTYVFKFQNVGNAPLIINTVHTSCGCTVADYPKEKIAPGASGEIVIKYDAKGKIPGRFKRHIQVFTNSKEEFTRITIQGNLSALRKEDIHTGLRGYIEDVGRQVRLRFRYLAASAYYKLAGLA